MHFNGMFTHMDVFINTHLTMMSKTHTYKYTFLDAFHLNMLYNT